MANSSRTKTPIHAVVFDYGQVLSRPPLRSDVEAMAEVFNVSVSRFQELYWRFRLAYDRGDLDAATYWTQVAQLAAGNSNIQSAENKGAVNLLEPGTIEKLIQIDTESWSRPDEKTLHWAAQLHRENVELAVLSNMPLELSRNIVAKCDWLSLFDNFTFSCDARSVKPEAAIYRACLEKLKIPADKVLFLDDRVENVEGALALGMNGVVFDDLERTIKRVKSKFDLPVPA